MATVIEPRVGQYRLHSQGVVLLLESMWAKQGKPLSFWCRYVDCEPGGLRIGARIVEAMPLARMCGSCEDRPALPGDYLCHYCREEMCC